MRGVALEGCREVVSVSVYSPSLMFWGIRSALEYMEP